MPAVGTQHINIQPLFIHGESSKLTSLWGRVLNKKIQMLRIIEATIKDKNHF